MRIVFRAVAMIMGVVLLAGLIGLVLLNQVLAVVPLRTPPVSAEDVVLWRKVLAETPESAPQS
jgi:hypothetical protein